MQSIKEHNLKANHNLWKYGTLVSTSVCNLSKNTIWKQITTERGIHVSGHGLYAIYQRTQSESKSQLSIWVTLLPHVCMQSIKEHNLKANHNSSGEGIPNSDLYAIYQRTQSESKSQLAQKDALRKYVCMQSIKEHNLKANHNHSLFSVLKLLSVCNLSKNTIWKQITTIWRYIWNTGILYAIYQRTQSESKSQLLLIRSVHYCLCMQSIKEHNLKANHNSDLDLVPHLALYAIYQRTQSESKSQLCFPNNTP